MAKNVVKNGDIIEAKEQVLLFSPTYLISADMAKYDQKNGIVELFGNVNMMRSNTDASRSNYARINLNTHDVSFKRIFGVNKQNEVWLRSDEAYSENKIYYTKKVTVSSCNVADPDWSINASSAELKDDFLHLYNPVFKIGEVPVFWLPYFAFNTNTKRRTGLLYPDFGYSRSEGFYYRQPVYFAPSDNWDWQFDPQIRTKRGQGLYTTFRFVDSPYSSGEISAGAFRDRKNFKNTDNVNSKYRTHKGFGVEYSRDRLIAHLLSPKAQEGLWINATFLNDIEYLNLKNRGDDYDSLVESRLNYFMSNSKHYAGIYAKYYIDTQKIGYGVQNKDTLQELPSLQYHKFTDSFLLRNLLYSVDLSAHRYEREVGVTATQYEFNAPISLHLPLLNEAFTLSLYENIYASQINYGDKRTSKDDNSKDRHAQSFENYHRFVLHTDLARRYESFFHTLNLGFEYILPGEYKGGDNSEFIYDENGREYENFLSQEKKREEASLFATQYFYSSSGRKFLRHSVSQGYLRKDGKYSSLKHSLHFYPFSWLTLYNKFEYSQIEHRLNSMQTGISASAEMGSIDFWHTMRRTSITNKNSSQAKESYLNAAASINLPHQYSLNAGIQYDNERDFTKMWRVGIAHSRKCWNYSLAYRSDIEPTTTSEGVRASRKQGVFFSVAFYPMGGIHYSYSVSSDKNSTAN
ncbi:LPS-assembly protein LptD [Campylobacter sp. 19-13652]|nr:LPS-assembly protein LptD [Campylobacter sp. 19-13652]